MQACTDKTWEQIQAELSETDRQEFVAKFGHLFEMGSINSSTFNTEECSECWLWVVGRGIGTRVNEAGIKDIVTVQATDLEPIPAGSNAFHYDLFHMGTELVREWIILHEGSASGTDALRYMILVNRNTGQRIRINLVPAMPGVHHEAQLEALKEQTLHARFKKEGTAQ